MTTIMSSSAALFGLLTLLGAPACDRAPEPKPSAPPPASPALPSAPLPTPQASAAAVVKKSLDTTSVGAPHYQLPATPRIVAIGDVHGDLNALRRALRLGGAIDGDDRWLGDKELTVVQTGDQLDRGDQDREVLDFIEKLEGDAKNAGSTLLVLNGNHELMNAALDFRYVTRKSFVSFDEYKSQAGDYAARLPDDERGRAAALAPGGTYALKLAKHLTVARVGDNLFVHGGLLPAHVDYGFDRLNREASEFLRGNLRSLPPALSAEDSPIWTRAYGGDVDAAGCEALGRVLAQTGAKRLIVGHTVQKSINPACQERVFRIDVGLSAFYGDHPAQVLEITAQGARVLIEGQTPAAEPRKKSQSAAPALHSSP